MMKNAAPTRVLSTGKPSTAVPRPVPSLRGISRRNGSRATSHLVAAFKAAAWLPTLESIEEGDKKRRVMINQRFEAADKDGNGRIDLEELRCLLESACSDSIGQSRMKHWLSEEEVRRLMNRYDLDNSGDLAADEFQQLVNDGLLLDEKLADYQAAFAAVDADGSGDISAEELRCALRQLGWPEREDDMDEMLQLMKKYGVSAAGRIDFQSFMALIKDKMLDVSELLSYLGARPESPSTTSNVIHAVSQQEFQLVMSSADLEAALSAAGERMVLLMAGTTWCSSSRAMVHQVKKLAAAYPSVVVLMLWGNVNAATKELFRDQLKVRSTPAFFLFRGANDLVCHWAGGDAALLEAQLRRRLQADSEAPAQPLFATADGEPDE